jgi:hypothetical protein
VLGGRGSRVYFGRDSRLVVKMPNRIRSSLSLLGLSLALVANLLAQQGDDPQRMTLSGLRTFAVYAKVQRSQRTTLPAVDENFLRSKIEQAIRQAGMSIVSGNDVRDGPGAHLSLLYMVIETRDRAGQETGFAAFSCLQAEQTVSLPRLGRYVYAVVPTWRSCGLLAGDSESYSDLILRNADQQITRFLAAWRMVNAPRPAPSFPSNPEVGMVKERTSRCTV